MKFRTKFLLPLLLPCLMLLAQLSQAKDIIVSPNGPYTTLSTAIEAAEAGDRILVNGGTYLESNLRIDKPLSLLGKDQPIIDGQYQGELLTISSNNVRVEGFSFRHVEVSYIKDHAAIRVVESKNVTLANNQILDAFFGIYLQKSTHCIIKNNQIAGQSKTESSSGNAIHLWYSNHILIEGNTVSGHRDGIYLEFVKDSQIRENLSFDNLRYGLHFMFSDGNTYRYNTFKQNGAGVAVMYTKNIVMEHNSFVQNWGGAAYGLLLKDISNSTIANNRFEKNTTGIYMEGSSRLQLRQNEFLENGWAIKLLSSCAEDTFRLNSFIGNTFDVASNGNTQLNHFEGNYWAKYDGYDLDRDQVGDVPYRPVSLYSVVVEKVPPAIMFMRSFIVDMMDAAEKVLPAFTPDGLVDNQPAMVKPKEAKYLSERK